jgi:hypothetical protein
VTTSLTARDSGGPLIDSESSAILGVASFSTPHESQTISGYANLNDPYNRQFIGCFINNIENNSETLKCIKELPLPILKRAYFKY